MDEPSPENKQPEQSLPIYGIQVFSHNFLPDEVVGSFVHAYHPTADAFAAAQGAPPGKMEKFLPLRRNGILYAHVPVRQMDFDDVLPGELSKLIIVRNGLSIVLTPIDGTLPKNAYEGDALGREGYFPSKHSHDVYAREDLWERVNAHTDSAHAGKFFPLLKEAAGQLGPDTHMLLRVLGGRGTEKFIIGGEVISHADSLEELADNASVFKSLTQDQRIVDRFEPY
ncbi:hypothetical protein HYU13_03635 [Candidatus Woesearchaeota archaeon]|nr:hypothetical protein [Candidatus Woesearchaeota archaeon]